MNSRVRFGPDHSPLWLGILTGFATWVVAMLPASTVIAAEETYKIYVKIDQSKDPADFVTGDVTDNGFEGWIKAIAVGQNIAAIQRSAPNQRALPQLGDFSIVKKVDRSTVKLLEAFHQGRTFARVTIVQRRESPEGATRQAVRVELQDVRLSGIQIRSERTDLDLGNTESKERPSVELSLTYDRVRWVYTLPETQVPPAEPLAFEIDASLGSSSGALDSDLDGVFNDADKDDDNDGVPDRYELKFGMDPLVDDSGGDLDRDERSNAAEFIAGTRADDSQSFFGIESISLDVDDPSNAVLSLRARTGRQYRLMGSPDGLTWAELRRFNGPQVETVALREVSVPLSGGVRLFRVDVQLANQ